MTDDTEILTKNTLFLAVTRPALWAGIPIEAAVLLLISSASVLIWSNSPVYAAPAISAPTGAPSSPFLGRKSCRC